MSPYYNCQWHSVCLVCLPPSLRGAKRRGNPIQRRYTLGLPRSRRELAMTGKTKRQDNVSLARQNKGQDNLRGKTMLRWQDKEARQCFTSKTTLRWQDKQDRQDNKNSKLMIVSRKPKKPFPIHHLLFSINLLVE